MVRMYVFIDILKINVFFVWSILITIIFAQVLLTDQNMAPKGNNTGLTFDLEKAIRLQKFVESGNFDVIQAKSSR